MAVVSLKNKVKSRSMLAGNPQGTAPIPGYSLWLDASDASTFSYSSGTRVSEWRDKSGNGHHFVQATSGSQPDRTDTQNGLSAVRMRTSTTTYFVTNTSLADWSASNFTVLAVVRFNLGAYSALIGRNSTANLQIGTDAANPNAIAISRIGQATSSSNLTQASGVTSQVTYKSAGISGGSISVQIYQNKTAASSAVTLGSMSTNGNKNIIGASADGGADNWGTNAFLCELILYRSQLSDYDRLSVENYLMAKWGL